MSRVLYIEGTRVLKEFEPSARHCVADLVVAACGKQEFERPTVAILNGTPVLRKDSGWQRTLVHQNACLIFVVLPLGGGDNGGSGAIAQIGIMVAVAIASIYTAGLASAAWAAASTAAGYASAIGWTAVSIGIGIVGTLLSNALASKAQSLEGPQAADQASPTYNINASGNMARLEQPEAEGFGRMKITPDYVARSYTEYNANDQYGYFVYGVGRGLYQAEQLLFGDTAFWKDGQFILDSGYVSEDGPICNKKVNKNLSVGTWTSGYIVVPKDELSRTLYTEINFPNGYGIQADYYDESYYDENSGGGQYISQWIAGQPTFEFQYAPVDDDNNIGAWSSSVSKSFAKKNFKSKRSVTLTTSFRAPKLGRWAVRCRITSELKRPTRSVGGGYDENTGQYTEPEEQEYGTVQDACKLKKFYAYGLSVKVQFVETGNKVTIFPDNVETNTAVTGLELFAPNEEGYPSGGWIGPYAANSPGTTTNEIHIDYAYVSGLGYYDDEGGFQSMHVDVECEAQQIDDYGATIGGWIELDAWTDSAATMTPQRYTKAFKLDVAGRYQVRMRRTNNTDEQKAVDTLQWVGLRAVLPGSLTYPQYVIAVKIKANNVLSQQAAQQFYVIQTRKLPVYDLKKKSWSAEPQVTRSWAAAVCAVCQEPWGGKMSDRQLDLESIWKIDAELSKKGWTFDAYIDGAYNLWTLISEMARSVLCVPRLQGSVLSFIEDKAGKPVQYELNARNIVRNSFQVTYNTFTEGSPDDVVMDYLDEEAAFAQRDVQATLPDSESIEPVTLNWIGIVKREQAFRVALGYAARNRHRRITVECQVEALGRLIQIGDVVQVNHPRFRNTASGIVKDYDPAALTFELQSDFDSSEKPTYISLVMPNGQSWGPVKIETIDGNLVSLNSSDYSAYLLQGNPDVTDFVRFGENGLPTQYALHTSKNFSRKMLVQSIQADDLWHYTLTLLNDTDKINDYDSLKAPAWKGRKNSSQGIVISAPTNIYIRVLELNILFGWSTSAGAVQYDVHHSTDGVTWVHDGMTTQTNISIPRFKDPDGTFYVRVAAISSGGQSVWTQKRATLSIVGTTQLGQ